MSNRNRKPDRPVRGRADPAAEKTILHPRNPHRFRYDFSSLVASCPELASFVSVNQWGVESVDFSDPAAVKTLNRALLAQFYGIASWDIPPGYLCPPVPGRADYIHYAADLLSSDNGGVVPEGKTVSILDIGVGANCIYPIIGTRSYGWRFTGTETDPVSAAAAERIVSENPLLSGLVEIRLQADPLRIFRGVIRETDAFDLTVCNPPFHASAEDAAAGTARKIRNLGSRAQIAREDASSVTAPAGQPPARVSAPAGQSAVPARNFGGQGGELWCPGGEASFIHAMIEESILFSGKCLWFTTLVSRRENLDAVLATLKRKGAADIRTIDMAQGQKTSRIVAWTFLDGDERRLRRVASGEREPLIPVTPAPGS